MSIAVVINAPNHLHKYLDSIFSNAKNLNIPGKDISYFVFSTEPQATISKISSTALNDHQLSAEGLPIINRGFPGNFLYKFHNLLPLFRALLAKETYSHVILMDAMMVFAGAIGEELLPGEDELVSLILDPKYPPSSSGPSVGNPSSVAKIPDEQLQYFSHWFFPGLLAIKATQEGMDWIKELIRLIDIDDAQGLAGTDEFYINRMAFSLPDKRKLRVMPPDYAVPSSKTVEELGRRWGRKIVRKISVMDVNLPKFFFPSGRLISHSLESEDLGSKLYQVATVLATAQEFSMVPVFPLNCTRYRSSILRNIPRYDLEDHKFQGYPPEEFTYKKIPEPSGVGDILLIGGYQSFKYFDSYREQLMGHLLPANYMEFCSSFMKQVKEDGKITVSVNVRYQDGIEKIQDWLVFLGLDYYERAGKATQERIGGELQWLVFCDDVDFGADVCARLGDGAVNMAEFEWDEEFADVDVLEMIMASMCDHHILSNSPISPWVAFFGNQNCVTVAPANWFGKKAEERGIVAKDIYMDWWELIE